MKPLFHEDDEACALLAADPFALLVGFALDQQITVQQAFLGPLRIKQRVGTLDPRDLAATDLEPVFKEKPAVHRFPGAMANACRISPRTSPRSTAATQRGSGPRRATAPT